MTCHWKRLGQQAFNKEFLLLWEIAAAFFFPFCSSIFGEYIYLKALHTPASTAADGKRLYCSLLPHHRSLRLTDSSICTFGSF